jgi:hypothetical protein
VIIFLIVTVTKPVTIRSMGTMSVSANAGYALGTTVLASLIAVFTLSQVRMLWLEDLLAHADSDDAAEDARAQRRRIHQARTLLGIGSLASWFRFPQLTLCAGVMAAMAGAIVAGVAPSPLQRTKRNPHTHSHRATTRWKTRLAWSSLPRSALNGVRR